MKIIKEGKLPQEKKYQLTCGKCSTVFEFLLNEATPSPDQRDGSAHFVTCPLTGCSTDVWFHPTRAER